MHVKPVRYQDQHCLRGRKEWSRIESQWTARKREQTGVVLVARATLPQKRREGWGNPVGNLDSEKIGQSLKNLQIACRFFACPFDY
jgi:hypothetical protein